MYSGKGHTIKDKVNDEVIREEIDVAPIIKKLIETRLVVSLLNKIYIICTIYIYIDNISINISILSYV